MAAVGLRALPRRGKARDRRSRRHALHRPRRRRARASHHPRPRRHLAGAEDWGGYTVDEAALRHGAGVEEETTDAEEAYARFPEPEPTRYRDGWLPG